MKQLTVRYTLPLTFISFALFNKWWYALPFDARETFYYGFPFPFVGEGWHTSLSLQIFILEFFIDFITYFLFLFSLIFFIHYYLKKINPNKILSTVLWVMASLIICVAVLIAIDSNHIYYFKRPYDMQILESGYKFIWMPTEQP
jgi:hypothetical protein